MRYRLLGRSGLFVSEIGLGTMTYGGKGRWRPIGQLGLGEVEAQVKAAFDALAWLLHQPAVASVIVGAKTQAQLADNLAAADLRLSESELQRLDEASRLPAEYPGWMFERQNKDRHPGGSIT